MTNTAPADETTATPCLCSQFEAFDSEQLTEANLETGDYDSWTTDCTAETKKTFAPGHDAKLKSALIRWGSQDLDITQLVGGTRVSASAEQWASKFDFGYMVLAGLAKAQERAAAKAERDAKRAERKAAKGKTAERKLAESAKVVHDGNEARQEREAKSLAEVVANEEAKHAAEQAASRPEPEWDDAPEVKQVEAKVGRWTYTGVIEGDEFVYTGKTPDDIRRTRKFKLVK